MDFISLLTEFIGKRIELFHIDVRKAKFHAMLGKFAGSSAADTPCGSGDNNGTI